VFEHVDKARARMPMLKAHVCIHAMSQPLLSTLLDVCLPTMIQSNTVWETCACCAAGWGEWMVPKPLP
jgi:hypothetical protein